MEPRGKTIVITGAGGFIGRRLCERLRGEGARVVGLELPSRAAEAEAYCDRVVAGDVAALASVEDACKGADAVIHTAAVVSEDGPWALFRRVNVEGTRGLARAARRAGAARFVHLSSVMVYGFHFPPEVAEEGPLRGDYNPYCQTKIESEHAAMDFDQAGAMRVTIVRPGDVYGPRSEPWVLRPLRMMQRGHFVVPGGNGVLNPVHVDDLADGILLCLGDRAEGQAFNVSGGEAVAVRRYFDHLARMLGPRGVRVVPRAALSAAGLVASVAARLFAFELPASPSAVRFLTRPHAYSIAKARRVLGYAPRVSLEEGMAGVEGWLTRERPLG
jgi:nucleoside-diphosphate-sugar epimerase